jgi:hypothetical protein
VETAAANLTYNLVAAPQHGSLSQGASGIWTYTPAANFNGSDSIQFSVTDRGDPDGTLANALTSAPATVSLTISPVNDGPQGASNTVTTLEDTPYTFATVDFGFSDPNDTPANDLHAVKITTLPAAGNLTDNGVAVTTGQFVSVTHISDDKLTFTPAADANGEGYTSFGFQVQDDGGTANGGVDLDVIPRTMAINGTPVNDAPGANPDTAVTPEDTPVAIPAPTQLAKDTDVDGDVLTLTGVSNAVNGTVALDNDGNPVFTPALNFNGAASFDYTISDGHGGTATNTVAITVTPVNDAPGIIPVGNQTIAEGSEFRRG